ncbi:MAG TPA: alpha/beta hydrolase-fold protein [Brevundimonas sp.]|jgi:predicted alpha/beta superfamily hydrolase|uniref:alpha/beta hydrolase n=1 Tax=Brevundimonas sp. TaxID=1871086 RepID=UPI002C000CB7|nr:alpha/beta hydrolase-fold protein [Brevundimonas sp.]HRH21146.1 alpha/beta hydrolase-fold protein [Brevundimonas sp.]
MRFLSAVVALSVTMTLVGAVAAQAQSPQAAPAATVGESFTLPSTVMGMERELNVLLPAGYADQPDRTWPVVYLLDGGQAQDFPVYANIAADLMAAGEMAEVIFVGVASMDRQNELTWRSADRRIIRQWPNHGQSDRFRRFLEQEVKPWVETNYRTGGDDAVLGESAAALFIIETFLSTPDLFDRYLAVSPSMWWDRGNLGADSAALLAGHSAADRQLLLTIADEGGEMQAGLDALLAALATAPPEGLIWSYEPRHDLTHSTIFLQMGPAFLRQAYPPQPQPR